MPPSSFVIVVSGGEPVKQHHKFVTSVGSNRSGGCRLPAVLKRSSLLQSRLGCGIDAVPENKDLIVGLAKVKAGEFYQGPLTHWQPEEKLLFEFLSCPNDSYTLRIQEVARLQGPLPLVRNLHGTHKNLGAVFPLTNACHGTLWHAAYEVGSSSDKFIDISAPNLMKRWGLTIRDRMVAVEVPSCIAHAIMQGTWHHILLLGRTQCSQRIFPDSGWPPERFFQLRGTLAEVPTLEGLQFDRDNVEWVPERCAEVADLLRSLAPHVLANNPDHAMRSRLGQACAFLDVLSTSFKAASLRADDGRVFKYDALALIHLVALCWKLRGKHVLK